MRAFTILLFVLLVQGIGKAQDRQGFVIHASRDNGAVTDARVKILSTQQLLLKDHTGKYRIDHLRPADSIEIAHLSFMTIRVAVKDLLLNPVVLLESKENQLEEVQISTGYQFITKERATGSYATLDEKQLNRQVSTDIISRLDGNVPGMLFNRNSPRAISIRGQSTLFSESNPLIVLDNFPYEGDILDINPNDVEQITVLKDAAAASIWGAQAANGVIVITTKQGKRDKSPKLGFNVNMTIGAKPDLYYQPRMSTGSFIELEKYLFDKGVYKAAETNINKTPYTPVIALLIQKRDNPAMADQIDAQIEQLKTIDSRMDMDKYLYQNMVNRQYNINLSGGSKKQTYYISLGYDDNREELVRNGLKRLSANVKNTFFLLDDHLQLTTGVDLSERRQESPNLGNNGLNMTGQSQLYPYARLRNEDGSYARTVKNYPWSFIDQATADGLLDWSYRPLEEVYLTERTAASSYYRMYADLNYKIWDGLRVTALYQYTQNKNDFRKYNPPETFFSRDLINNLTQIQSDGSLIRPIPLGGILNTENSKSHNHAFRSQLDYQKEWQQHQWRAMAGFEIRDNPAVSNSNLLYGYNNDLAFSANVDFVNSYPRYVNPNSKQTIANGEKLVETVDRYRSFYGNIAYTYDRQLDFYASARLDQSNLFGVRTNQKGVPLWSVGMAYQLSKASFYKSEILPYLKLKASYGYNGNINKSITAFTTIRYYGNAILTGLPYARVVNPPNPALRWERTKVLNLGLDFASKDNRITGGIERYWKRGLDLIGETPYAPSAGVSSFTENYANTKTSGLDVQLKTKNFIKAFGWDTEYFLSIARDEVTHYLPQVTSFTGAQVTLVGKPQYGLYSYPFKGLNPLNGNPVGYLDGQESENYAAIIASMDEHSIVYHGSQRPTVFGGLRNTFTWRNLSLSVNMTYRLGYFYRRNTAKMTAVLTANSQHGDYEHRWQKPGDEQYTVIPSIPETNNANRDNFYNNTGLFVEKGDHLKLQDLKLSYAIAQNKLRKVKLQEVSFFVYANNLGIIWKSSKSSLDPDYPLVDFPPSRTVSFGLNFKF
ncbi:SusC/RagA family TonB-linked outer membrane protein [Sphingobacterium ginsenosidimutans]|uniref:SusC/RagA family TonB-linked outer membrane protein n=1 Tax=Sphingobacterium ginsenosidimutans TaxID=687845 RepID=A0ABP8A1D1_9SPHI